MKEIKVSQKERKRLIEAAKTSAFRFTDYYKYDFKFEAEFEGGTFLASVGGDAGDIYRLNVKPMMTYREFEAPTDLRFRVSEDSWMILIEVEW